MVAFEFSFLGDLYFSAQWTAIVSNIRRSHPIFLNPTAAISALHFFGGDEILGSVGQVLIGVALVTGQLGHVESPGNSANYKRM